MKLSELIEFLDDFLKKGEITDSSLNGLQVGEEREISRVATSVDASLKAFEAARTKGAELLIVHHGLFWDGPFPFSGVDYLRMKALFQGGPALYASHLPLDIHPQVGNSALLADLLELTERQPFALYKGGIYVGVSGSLPRSLSIEEVSSSLESGLKNRVEYWAFGKKEVRSVALVSGFGGDVLREGLKRFDLILTGGISLSFFRQAEDAGQSVVVAGHYATEKLGVRALGELLESHFGLKHSFLEMPCPY